MTYETSNQSYEVPEYEESDWHIPIQNTMDMLDSDVFNLHGRIDAAESDISTLQTDVSNNDTDISDLNTNVSNLDSRVTTAESDIDTNTTNINSNDTDISNLDSRVTTVETDGYFSDSEVQSAVNKDADHGSTASHNYYTDSDAEAAIGATAPFQTADYGDGSITEAKLAFDPGSGSGSQHPTTYDAVIWKDSGGTIHATSENGDLSDGSGGTITGTSLPTVVTTALDQSGVDSIGIKSGEYSYTEDFVITQGATRIHFENVALSPDGCIGFSIGDGTSEIVYVTVTGHLEIDPNNGSTNATIGLRVSGAKGIQIKGHISIENGFTDQGMKILGESMDSSYSWWNTYVGNWWNYYEGIYLNDTLLVTTPSPTGSDPDNDGTLEYGDPPNAQHFDGCLFKTGSITIHAGNSTNFHQCWFEAIPQKSDPDDDGIYTPDNSTDPASVTLDNGVKAYFHGRFEEVNFKLNSQYIELDLEATHWSKSSINDPDNITAVNIPSDCKVHFHGQGVDNPIKQFRADDKVLETKRSSGAQTSDAYPMFEWETTYDSSGSPRFVRMDHSSGRGTEGYYLQAINHYGHIDKEIESEGDYVNTRPGQGFVTVSPDGNTMWRIRVDNSGNMVSEEITDWQTHFHNPDGV